MLQKISVVVGCFLMFGLQAQLVTTSLPLLKSTSRIELQPNNTPIFQQKLTTLWESTFDNPAEWVIDHDAADCSLDWKIGNNTCQGPFYIDTIQSTSASDGWALLDSDEYGALTGGSDIEDAWLTSASPLDLTATPNVIVEFETFYRRYNFERPYLVVGVGDGFGNVVWPDLTPTTDISAMDNVFEIFPNWQDGQYSDNPYKVQIDVSSALTGTIDEVYFRINWTGQWGYALFVDDFKVLEQAQNDIKFTDVWVRNEGKDNLQYAKIPVDQLEANWEIGATVRNFGALDQTNVLFDADFTSFSVADTRPLMEVGAIDEMGSSGPVSTPVGLYQGQFTVVSDDETGGPEFDNNELLRNFEITDSLYALDGIDVHPVSELTLSSIGTATYENASDGLLLATMYHIKEPSLVSGLRIMLAPGSIPGGFVLGSIIDTSDFWMNDVDPIFQTEFGYVNAPEIANGYVDVYFPSPTFLDTGAFYAAVKLYSNDNLNQINISDDLTVKQPSFASAVHNSGTSYTNGNALGIRLLMNGGWLNTEENALESVIIYPNPSSGTFTVSNDHGTIQKVEIYNTLGQAIYSTESTGSIQLDLRENGVGLYLVKISNDQSSVTKKIIINK